MQRKFIEIQDVFVNSDVFETKFTCDLEKCKGACCTMESDYGAPLNEDEVEIINNILPDLKDYIPEISWNQINRDGFYEEKQGQLMTTSINKHECVFVYYDGDIAKCAIEKAYFDGKVKFRKPISCHLFPIRVSNFGGPVLKYEKYEDCFPALEKGNETNISVFEFCKDALERAFGKLWFKQTGDSNRE
ncbi:MAG: DUF3109 family protein [Bacteroidetes bacterium]|nr:DUF3109 family protein [Bacteroidota bacterium]